MPSINSGPTRRGLIGLVGVGAGVSLLGTGCRSDSPRPVATSVAPVDPQVARNRQLLTARLNAESSLIAAYEAALRSVPGVADQLAAPLAHHLKHRDLLASELRQHSNGPGSPVDQSVAPVPTTPVRPTPPSIPTAVIVANLAAMERASAQSARNACALATGNAAGLLGSFGAAEAAHADLLSTSGAG